MNNISRYLFKVKSAVELYFEGFHEYSKILLQRNNPVYTSLKGNEDERRKEYEAWRIRNAAALNKAREVENKYVDELFARSTFSGAILQLAHMGIKRYSTNQQIFDLVNHVIKPDSQNAKFCVGRIIKRIPIGLIILGGRNLYNHIDEESLFEPNVTIFNILAGEGYPQYIDSYYDINGGQRHNVISNLLYLLNWNSYGDFAKDLSEMIE